MHFDFESLFGQSPDLSYLEEPFSSQKINDVIQHLPLTNPLGQMDLIMIF
jgi:hypothetical protein